MAEPLKNHFGPQIAQSLGDILQQVYPAFDRSTFLREALVGYDDLELTPRAKQVAHALGRALPDDPAAAMTLITAATHAIPDLSDAEPMASFVFLPLVYCVAERGLPAFTESMQAQHALTQRFTAEFSIRAFLISEPERTMHQLDLWTRDPSDHVRRLVSEGSRPRLPWAPRLPAFQHDPGPVVALLTKLKDDPSEYVRRSVANNLNDIAKDHPDVCIATAQAWWPEADADGRRMLRHALRTLIKDNHPAALAVLGYVADPSLHAQIDVNPDQVAIGEQVRLGIKLTNSGSTESPALADLAIDFVKANGSTRRKVFKGAQILVPAGDTVAFNKSVSLRQHSTRKHYPGLHQVHVQVNGVPVATGQFRLLP